MLAIVSSAWAQASNDVGQKAFETRCGVCHGGDGGGGEMGPPLAQRLRRFGDPELIKLIHDGIPTKGMPPNLVKGPELAALVKFLRVIALRVSDTPVVRKSVQTTSGATLDGQVLGEGVEDMQLRTDDKKVHLLRRVANAGASAAGSTSGSAVPEARAASASDPSPLKRPGRPTTAIRAAIATRRSRRSTNSPSAVSRPPGSSPFPIPARSR